MLMDLPQKDTWNTSKSSPDRGTAISQWRAPPKHQTASDSCLMGFSAPALLESLAAPKSLRDA
jgi:hypothetical protein